MQSTVQLTALIAIGCLAVVVPGLNAEPWRDEVPSPVFQVQPELVEFYWKTWELAYDHVKTQPGLPQTPYMDEAFDDNIIWIWDTAFMTHFTKYAPENFPGIESFQNFYVPLHVNSEQQNQTYPLRIQHPDNPPLFAWSEFENFKVQGNTAHVQQLIQTDQFLQKHFNWFDTVGPGFSLPSNQGNSALTGVEKVTDMNGNLKGYKWSGTPSGMDNTPRGRDIGWGNMLWIDAISQQALSAKSIVELANAVGDAQTAATFQAKYDEIKAVVNTLYWDDQDGIYYDIHQESTPENITFSKVKTPASFWPLLAGLANPEQAARMAEHVQDPEVFGGPVPWTTVARNDPEFRDDGGYWRGGVWLPTAYMAIKALEEYGYDELAAETSNQLIQHMYKTYTDYEPFTIWEYYDPDEARPGQNQNARPDFAGWSALGPISLFIENVLGFVIDAQTNEIEWRLSQPGQVGLNGLHFGEITADIISVGDGSVAINSSGAFTLNVKGETFSVPAGESVFRFVEGLQGDVDQNGILEIADVAQFKLGWNTNTFEMTALEAYQKGDVNFDGNTNLSDWILIRNAFIAEGLGTLVGSNSIPEPSTGILASLGTLLLGGRKAHSFRVHLQSR